MKTQKPASESADVVSEPLLYPGRSGLKVAACWDHRREGFERCPFVIMAPKYGETKKNNLQLAYLLAANGMNVVRFDHTSHVGESAGVKTAFTLTSGVDDIHATLDVIEHRFGAASAALLASSLSSRTAVRAAAQDTRVSLLVCVVGVVNVQFTLREVYREDLVANYLAGKRWGVTDILGHDIDFDRFLGTACEAGMHDLAGTARDLEATRIPVVFFSGEDDAWVSYTEVQAVIARAPHGRVVCVPGAKHEVRENQAVAESAFREVVSLIVREAWGLDHAPAELRAPEQRALLAQNRVERERLRDAQPKAESETAFWGEYLRKYELLDRVEDYCGYLNLVGDLLGPIQPGEAVLDAGCGNGLFGAWLLRRMKSTRDAATPALYVGLDLTDRGLSDAMSRHGALAAARLRDAAAASGRTIDAVYARANFDRLAGSDARREIPRFAGHSFDAICCSLVLSYLERPGELLAELHRLLRSGGRIVVSSMKPHCDMSLIYRDFMDQRVSSTEVESARGLLRAAGQIKLKEEQGYYVFFSGEELTDLMHAAGFRDMQVFSSFGEQAVVVRATA